MPATGHSPLIERITVEEGFLDGLDLSFRPGLNVIIGPRGTGKTSIIELMRFCLGAPALTERFSKGARDHARSILGGGRVTVSCLVQGERFVVSRRYTDDEPEGDSLALSGVAPLVLSQNEIEAVGLDARGRTRLLDGFRNGGLDHDKERAALSRINSLSAEIAELSAEIILLEEQLHDFDEAKKALASAELDLVEQESSVEQTGGVLRDLDLLGAAIAERSVTTTILQRNVSALEEWQSQLETVRRAKPVLEPVRQASEAVPAAQLLSRQLVTAERSLLAAIAEVESAIAGLRNNYEFERKAVRAADDEAREKRRQVEAAQEGAGVAARRLASLREHVAQLTALQKVHAERGERLAQRQQQRRAALGDLEDVREARFQARSAVAHELTADLGPQIEIAVQRSGIAADYAQAIADVLRGSGLQYGQLSLQLSSQLAPHEFVRAAEDGDAGMIAKAGGISKERAARVIERVREQGTGRLLSADVDDAALFRLLVGGTYRDTTELSTGQRCTVVLSVLLNHWERPVVIDQPEDHLDNAFVVQTLVRAIRQRPGSSQLIVSTHNPNVPVLGDAAQVTVLASDGKRGYDSHTGDLDEPATVDAITSIMEGGREAFEQRARFYESHEG
jgi:AAA domain